jgi:hypothetical protein
MGAGADSGATTTYGASGGFEGQRARKVDYAKPVDKKRTSVTYSADDNTLLLDIAAASESATSTSQINAVSVKNDGNVSAIASFAYTQYDTESDSSEAVEYVQYLLNPDEEIIIPATRAIITADNAQHDGTAVTATQLSSNRYADIGAYVDGAGLASDTAATTFDVDDNAGSPAAAVGFFRVGDKIRLEDEIMEVTAIAANTGTEAQLTVKRGVDGSVAATHADNIQIRLPYYNMYSDWDRYSYAQTDSLGRYKTTNFFSLGRTNGNTKGITAGSIALQFYESGYQSLGLTDITANTESGLTASTAYEFDIAVDGGTTFDNLTFTVDSSNTKFGGSTGIIAKIQDALDTQYYTSGNLFEKKVTVSIEGGDIVFRSSSSTSASAISLGAGSTGAADFLGSGRIPNAVGAGGKEINAPVDAKLQTETIFDPVTNGETYKNIFIRDDGRGNLIWRNTRNVGTVNYETGEIDFTVSEKPNAEFVVSVLHTSPFSGKLNSSDADRANSLKQIFGNTPQQKCEAILTVTTY